MMEIYSAERGFFPPSHVAMYGTYHEKREIENTDESRDERRAQTNDFGRDESVRQTL